MYKNEFYFGITFNFEIKKVFISFKKKKFFFLLILISRFIKNDNFSRKNKKCLGYLTKLILIMIEFLFLFFI